MSSADEKYRVTLREKSLANLPFRVLTQLFWRPQAFESQKTGQLPDDIRERKVDQLNHRWQRQEVWVNQAVDAVFGALPPPAIGELMHTLIPAIKATPLTPYECRAGAMKRHLGVPDLFFSGEGQAVAGEIKIGATAQSGKYSFEQYTKYLSLALFLRASRRPDLPTRVAHLLVVPKLEPKTFCSDFDHWKPEIREGWLTVNPKNVRYADRKKRFDDKAGWREEVLSPMRNKKYADQNEIDAKVVAAIETSLDVDLLQTRVVTWEEFAKYAIEVANGYGLGHLADSCSRLHELGREPQSAD